MAEPATGRAALPRLRAMPATARPPNALRRHLLAWVERRCALQTPEGAAEARRIDAWLASRSAWGFWVGLLAALVASVAGLVAGGFPWTLALGSSLIVWLGLPAVALGAWLQPHKFTARRLWRNALSIGALAYAGAFVGFLVGRIVRFGGLHTETLAESLWKAATASLPLLLVLLGAMLLLLWGVAQVRGAQDHRQLAQLALVQERDAAARRAAEAQLRLLHAQIQPHFIFNTLAALQHWVDTGDARASGLLRELTAFLRGSTDALGRTEVTLAEEAAMAAHYLTIMQARLGARLRFTIDVDADVAHRTLPAGLLLTLVENAVEHGLSPALAGGTVAVSAGRTPEGWQLCVADDGAGLAADAAAGPEGVGLANSRERVAHHFGDRARLTLEPLAQGAQACLRVQEAAGSDR